MFRTFGLSAEPHGSLKQSCAGTDCAACQPCSVVHRCIDLPWTLDLTVGSGLHCRHQVRVRAPLGRPARLRNAYRIPEQSCLGPGQRPVCHGAAAGGSRPSGNIPVRGLMQQQDRSVPLCPAAMPPASDPLHQPRLRPYGARFHRVHPDAHASHAQGPWRPCQPGDLH